MRADEAIALIIETKRCFCGGEVELKDGEARCTACGFRILLS